MGALHVNTPRRSEALETAGNWRAESGVCIDFLGAFGDHFRLIFHGSRALRARGTSGSVLSSRFFVLCVAFAASLFSAAIPAQSLRQLPDDVDVATMVANGGSIVLLDEQQVRLSPAAQVRGANNLIIVPASLYGTHKVAVKQDFQGMVNRIWILTDDELAALREKQK